MIWALFVMVLLLSATLVVQFHLILKVGELRVTMGVVEGLLKKIDRIPLPHRPNGRDAEVRRNPEVR
jgi:hypothetical protein